MIRNKTIGIIGCGNMGAALIEYLKKKAKPKDIFILDKDKDKQDRLIRGFQIKASKTIQDMAVVSDVVIIAVKPQDIEEVLLQLKGIHNKLVISIAAGIPLAFLEENIGKNVAVIRAMPNLNAIIGQSMTALCANKNVKKDDLEIGKAIFKAVGEVVFVQERQMNAFTAIAGSGPAFVAYLRNFSDDVLNHILIEEAEHLGLDHNTATASANATVAGTRQMMRVSLDPDILIKRVSSKGGTTEAGMKILEERGKTEEALSAAVRAACKRAEELSQGS